MNEEIWVFLSHSHRDYDKVSVVRNLLEQRGYKPLMFYLKCLNDDCEIDSLIKREIDSRAYFILCDSRNARQSLWVQEEENYIKDKGRIYEIIDIESEKEQIEESILHFERREGAFISYSRHNIQQAHTINEELQANGYNTWLDMDKLGYGMDFRGVQSSVNNAITKFSNEGFVIILLDQHYIGSRSCLAELRMALGERRTNVSSILVVSLDGTNPLNVSELKKSPVRWIDAAKCGIKVAAEKVVSFMNFYNTSYRRVYNMCWEYSDLSKMEYENVCELNELPIPAPPSMDKIEAACRYILGINAPTDIDYAMQLLQDAATEGDSNAAQILNLAKDYYEYKTK